jgi:mannose-6-phosphate isomerase-like protein (cupin superfamily)
VVVHGVGEVTIGEQTFLMTENQSTYIPQGEFHRLANPGKVPLEIIEVQTGTFLGDEDIERVADVYGRVDPHDPLPASNLLMASGVRILPAN